MDSEGKQPMQEMSLTIKRAWIDPKTKEKRWRADASNTDDDLAQDNMTLDLFKAFVDKIESEEPVPEEYRSEYWDGGIPYLSISHYPDLNGAAVPGTVDAVYIDGKYLKAKGRFSDTPLGNACWKSVCEDLERIKKGDQVDDKIRISIAFLDYKHKHKSTGYEFTRNKLDSICPKCFLEIVQGERSGRSFLDGHLIHLAMTRVPMAIGLSEFEPDMEVERSMTTRKEDAVSIVKDVELIEEIDSKASLVGKSEALVVKSEDEEVKEEVVEEEVKEEQVVEEPEVQAEPQNEISEIKSMMVELKSLVNPAKPEPHALDSAIAQLKSDFDGIMETDNDPDMKLQMVQESYAHLGEKIVEVMRSQSNPEPEVLEPQNEIAKAIVDALRPLADKVDLLISQNEKKSDAVVPQRRSISPTLAMKSDPVQTGKMTIGQVARRGLID
jgi:hypothetical protein